MNIEKWGQTRLKGKFRFILFRGIILNGIVIAFFFTFVMQYLQPNYNVWKGLAIALVLFSVSGYFVGNSMWKQREQKYAESTGI